MLDGTDFREPGDMRYAGGERAGNALSTCRHPKGEAFMRVVIAGRYDRDDKVKDGVIVHVRSLARYLSRARCDVHIVTLGSADREYFDGDIRVHTVKRFSKRAILPVDSLALRRKILEIDPDVVHAHESWYPYSTALMLLPKKYSRIATIHGNVQYEARCLRKTGLRAYAGALLGLANQFFVLRWVGTIIVVTPFLRTVTKDKGVTVIPNGFDFQLEEYKKSEYREDLKSDVLYVGELSHIKGVDILIRAVDLAKRKLPDLKVKIVGTGVKTEELRSLVQQLSLSDNIEFMGYVDGVEKFSLIRSAKICVFPSRSDMAPSTILESMACEKPVIASSVAGIPYIVEDGVDGLLFPSEDEARLAERIVQALGDERFISFMGRNAERKVKDRYSWGRISAQTRALYEAVRPGGTGDR